VLCANQLFRAVCAVPGHHEIVFYYRQRGLLAGMLISATTFLVLVLAYIRNPNPLTREPRLR